MAETLIKDTKSPLLQCYLRIVLSKSNRGAPEERTITVAPEPLETRVPLGSSTSVPKFAPSRNVWTRVQSGKKKPRAHRLCHVCVVEGKRLGELNVLKEAFRVVGASVSTVSLPTCTTDVDKNLIMLENE